MTQGVELEDAVLYFVSAAVDGLPVPKLTTFVFLAEVEHQRLYGEPLTASLWHYDDDGPFSTAVYSAVESLARQEIVSCEDTPACSGTSLVYVPSHSDTAAGLGQMNPRARRVLTRIVERFGTYSIDHVTRAVYATETMKHAQRGERLDFSRESAQGLADRLPDLTAFLQSVPDPDVREYGSPEASAQEDIAILAEFENLRRDANQELAL